MSKLFLRPATGLAVPMPDGTALPPDGGWAEDNLYWQRRIAEGDVAIAEPPAEPAAKKGRGE